LVLKEKRNYSSQEQKRVKGKENNQENENNVITVRFSQESQPYKKSLKGQINEAFEEWLRRSLVCTTGEPRELATLALAIIEEFVNALRFML